MMFNEIVNVEPEIKLPLMRFLRDDDNFFVSSGEVFFKCCRYVVGYGNKLQK